MKLPGLALAAATKSCWIVLMPFDGAITSAVGILPIGTTAAKSRAAS